MGYYLITAAEYTTNHESNCDHDPAYTLDGTKCIIHVDDDYTVSNYIQYFADNNSVNEWRFDTDTTEWQNWETIDEHNGII